MHLGTGFVIYYLLLQLPWRSLSGDDQSHEAVQWIAGPVWKEPLPLPSVRSGRAAARICQVIFNHILHHIYRWQLFLNDKYICGWFNASFLSDWVQSTVGPTCWTSRWMRSWWKAATWSEWSQRARWDPTDVMFVAVNLIKMIQFIIQAFLTCYVCICLVQPTGGTLQAAHLRPQLHPRPRPQGGPGDPCDLHPQPPHQKHQRCQFLPDHHSSESG